MIGFGTVLGVESCLPVFYRQGGAILLYLRMRKAEAVEAMFEVCRNLPSGPVLLQWPVIFLICRHTLESRAVDNHGFTSHPLGT